jgi:hypothetical protein
VASVSFQALSARFLLLLRAVKQIYSKIYNQEYYMSVNRTPTGSPLRARTGSPDPNSRARSPLLFNESAADRSPLYQEAMAKVYEAAWKFDRGKDGDFLKVRYIV